MKEYCGSPCVPTTMNDMTLHVEGLRWHDPDHASRGVAHCASSTAFL